MVVCCYYYYARMSGQNMIRWSHDKFLHGHNIMIRGHLRSRLVIIIGIHTIQQDFSVASCCGQFVTVLNVTGYRVSAVQRRRKHNII